LLGRFSTTWATMPALFSPFFCFFFFWERVSLWSLGWPQTLDLPEWWNYRLVPPCLALFGP
jgi:hypothetical protein